MMTTRRDLEVERVRPLTKSRERISKKSDTLPFLPLRLPDMESTEVAS